MPPPSCELLQLWPRSARAHERALTKRDCPSASASLGRLLVPPRLDICGPPWGFFSPSCAHFRPISSSPFGFCSFLDLGLPDMSRSTPPVLRSLRNRPLRPRTLLPILLLLFLLLLHILAALAPVSAYSPASGHHHRVPAPQQPPPEAQDGDYAVELAEGADPDAVAKKAGCANLGNVANIPNFYLFRPLPPHGGEQGFNARADSVSRIEERMRTLGEVVGAERQVKRDRKFEKRDEL
ncbi:hypothetical protein DFJ74DRAFT_648592 [Hyaloraphidium curvatum]|nr:hypothetical protein DFJ74DRAFT_648592 [Hyaloraphidium curvatum]